MTGGVRQGLYEVWVTEIGSGRRVFVSDPRPYRHAVRFGRAEMRPGYRIHIHRLSARAERRTREVHTPTGSPP